MKITLTRSRRRSLLTNVRIPHRHMTVNQGLLFVIRIAEILDKAGFKYVRLLAGNSGYIIATMYGRRPVRFVMTPISRTEILGQIYAGHRYQWSTGIIKVGSGLLNIISDITEEIPSMTIQLGGNNVNKNKDRT